PLHCRDRRSHDRWPARTPRGDGHRHRQDLPDCGANLRLLESQFARRFLFLVDRKALAAQAVREFNAFTTPHNQKFTQEYEVYSQKFQKEDFGDDDPFDPKVLPNEYLTAPKSSHTFVSVSTIQRM